ncbi:nucleoside 2-deoxyribosyltransferase [Geodermatophilus saharensis]|nr:nucleoside 2-deoxyribosyltransferase [Geodermatophilus saharensis]
MRFDDTPTMGAIDAGVRAAATRHGRDVVRADDRDYTGELWANVALCMHHSDLVIAVLDQIEQSDCDANVMVELGFALAAGLRCLILVERRMHGVPAVLRHRLTYPFDALELPGSIDRQVDNWLERNRGG